MLSSIPTFRLSRFIVRVSQHGFRISEDWRHTIFCDSLGHGVIECAAVPKRDLR
jgi:hypothetical protein